MENLIQLHFKFDVLSLSYADFIREIADNGLPLDAERTIQGYTLTCSVQVPEEIATVLKLKFGYFQIKVKSKEQIEKEQLEYLKLYQELLEKQFVSKNFFEDQYLTKPEKDPYSKTEWYDQIKKKATSKDRHNPWLDGMKF